MSISLFDSHSDSLHVAWRHGRHLRENDLMLDLVRGSAFAPRGQVFSIWSDPRTDPPVFDEVLDFWERELALNGDLVVHCRSAADILDALAAGKCAALISVEGCEQIGCSTEKLQYAKERGVAIVHLCWNYDNALTGSATDGRGGLTAEGRRFVAEALRLGILIDLSHSSDAAFWDVLEMTEKPVLAGHSDARALVDHPRNLTDDQFTALAKRGGVAGLNFSPRFLGHGMDIDAIVAHAEHFLSLGGEKAVCLGADLDGVTELPGGFTGIQDFGKLYEAMLRQNWTETLVQDIFGGNLLAFLEREI